MADPNTRRAFLQTIADNPDDDAPRLIYADQLDEWGEGEHAELIRVQCELEKHYSICVLNPGEFYLYQSFDGATVSLIKNESNEARMYDSVSFEDITKLKNREQLLFDQLNDGRVVIDGNVFRHQRFRDWERGFVVRASGPSVNARWWPALASKRHPLHTLRLTDWRGIKESLPDNPRERLPFLKRLELPRPVHINTREPFTPTHSQTNFLLGECITNLRTFEVYLPDVEVAFYEDRHLLVMNGDVLLAQQIITATEPTPSDS